VGVGGEAVSKREEISESCKSERVIKFIICAIHHILLERFSQGRRDG
jgi:hypothetical protein